MRPSGTPSRNISAFSSDFIAALICGVSFDNAIVIGMTFSVAPNTYNPLPATGVCRHHHANRSNAFPVSESPCTVNTLNFFRPDNIIRICAPLWNVVITFHNAGTPYFQIFNIFTVCNGVRVPCGRQTTDGCSQLHGNTIIRIPRRPRFICHNRHPEKTIGCGHRRRRGEGHLIITLDLRSRWQYRRPLYAIPGLPPHLFAGSV